LKFYATVRAYLRGALLAIPFFLCFLPAVNDTALVAAKSATPSFFASLIYMLAALRTDVTASPIIPFVIIVFNPAFVTTVFLMSRMACSLKRFSAAHAF
jgi:hypothetical protein